LPKRHRRYTRFTFKKFTKALRMFKAKGKSDFTNRETGSAKLFFGFIYKLIMYVLLGALSRKGFQHPTKVVGRYIKAIGHLLHGRQPIFGQGITTEIAVKQGLKAAQYFMICFVAGNELAVVKAVGVG